MVVKKSFKNIHLFRRMVGLLANHRNLFQNITSLIQISSNCLDYCQKIWRKCGKNWFFLKLSLNENKTRQNQSFFQCVYFWFCTDCEINHNQISSFLLQFVWTLNIIKTTVIKVWLLTVEKPRLLNLTYAVRITHYICWKKCILTHISVKWFDNGDLFICIKINSKS